ncbi:hypothetical protein EDB89DRAFT_1935777 [Lactarius sanguifluus]|nr:hypothetical protein EDB89DRAFT_1935777 [Lactarius sanguifluus]
MEVPFPLLTHLKLTGNKDRDTPYLSKRFLGGSAPCLQHLSLVDVGLLDLPKLILSARDLVSLRLDNIPPWGHTLPEEIVGGLVGLTRLRTLSIRFPIPYKRWGSPMDPSPQSCAVLPALTKFEFQGGSNYLDELTAQIDTPRVEDVRIEYSDLDVQAPQFPEFIKRSQFKRARVGFSDFYIILDRPQGECHQAHHSLSISDPEFEEFDMARVLGQLVPMLSNVVHLSVLGPYGVDDMLPLLRLFPAVEVMDVPGKAAGYIASALEDITEDMVAEVLPALQLLLLGDDTKLEGFLSLRRLSGRPVTIVNTHDEFVERLNARWEKV